MTENEAIRRLKDHFRIHDDGRPTPFLDEAVSMAIQALEEIQQYRTIGTVEEFEELLEYRAIGSIERIKSSIETNYVLLHAYEEIGTIEEFKALKEKSVAKKPIRDKEFSSLFECPSCGRRQKIIYGLYHCKECGQKLDWQ